MSLSKSAPHHGARIAISFGTKWTWRASIPSVTLQEADTYESIIHSYKGYKEIYRLAKQTKVECAHKWTHMPSAPLLGPLY